MSEQELQQENERLRRELAELREERDNLHKWVCSMIPVDHTELTPEEVEELVQKARPVDELLRDILPREFHYLISETDGKS